MYRACWLLSYLFAYGNGCLVLSVWGHSEWRNREILSRHNHPPPKLSNSDFSDAGPSRPPTCNYDHHLVFPSVLMSGSRKIVYFRSWDCELLNCRYLHNFISTSFIFGALFLQILCYYQAKFRIILRLRNCKEKKIPLRGGSSALMNSFIRKMLIEVEAKWKMLRYSEAKTC